MFDKQLKKYADHGYFVFRVLVSLLFMGHGAMKLFGWFGGTPADLMSLMGAAGVIEVFGGAMLLLGLWTRCVAVITALEMLVAYFYMHVPSGGLDPFANRGELALLYFAAFAVMATRGSGKWAVKPD